MQSPDLRTIINFAASTVPTAVDGRIQALDDFCLMQNYPNPFNPTTTIEYTIAGTRGQGPGVSEVRLVVYDMLGREVATIVDDVKGPGTYTVRFSAKGGDASKLCSGMYFYKLTAGDPSTPRPLGELGAQGSGARAQSRGFAQTKRLLLLR